MKVYVVYYCEFCGGMYLGQSKDIVKIFKNKETMLANFPNVSEYSLYSRGYCYSEEYVY